MLRTLQMHLSTVQLMEVKVSIMKMLKIISSRECQRMRQRKCTERLLDTSSRGHGSRGFSGGLFGTYANVYSKVQYQSLVKKNGTSITEGNEGTDLLAYAAKRGMDTYGRQKMIRKNTVKFQ